VDGRASGFGLDFTGGSDLGVVFAVASILALLEGRAVVILVVEEKPKLSSVEGEGDGPGVRVMFLR
jgi:hypothetical protein